MASSSCDKPTNFDAGLDKPQAHDVDVLDPSFEPDATRSLDCGNSTRDLLDPRVRRVDGDRARYPRPSMEMSRTQQSRHRAAGHVILNEARPGPACGLARYASATVHA